jgi:anaerobic magnesium-protoporphyrin IX monomethyl ester cyclase
MKIVLINPPLEVEENYEGKLELYQPLGLAYVAASLEKAGHKVKIIDCVIEGLKNIQYFNGKKLIGLSNKEIESRTLKENPDVIGITGMSPWKNSLFNIAKSLKKKKIPIICGGPIATVEPLTVLDNRNIDFAVIGEGEITFVELLKVIKKPNFWHTVQGIGFKKKGRSVLNKPKCYNTHLDSLPFPARHLLPMEKYFKAASYYEYSRGKASSPRATGIITSRGCPFNCVFCSAKLLAGKNWRPRSAENVIAEMEECISKYRITDFYFEDENMSLNKERMNKILDSILKNGWKVTLHSPQGLRADTLDREILEKMKKAGYKDITIGVETGSQKVMDEVVDKKLRLEKVVEIVKNCREIGIDVSCFFVIGMVGPRTETKEEIKETLRFARKLRKLGAYHCTTRNALPVPGTRMHKIAKEKGYLLLDDWVDFNKIYVVQKHFMRTPEWEPKEVIDFVKQAEIEDSRDLLSSTHIIKKTYFKKFIKGMITSPRTTIRIVLNLVRSTIK